MVELQYKIVLQQVLYCRGCWRYVAIQILYCRQLAGKAVSRYKICIMTEVAGIGLQYKILYCDWAGAPGAQAGQALGARRRACVGRAGRHCRQLGARARGAAGERARGRVRQARGRGRQGAAGARQGAAGSGRRATGWASWVLVHSAWFSTWFFDSVFFLSHQMNTVHCKIKFEKNIF